MKPISLDILYKHPRQTQFLEQMITGSEALNFNNQI